MTGTAPNVTAALGATLVLGGVGSLTTQNAINSLYRGIMSVFGQQAGELVNPVTAIAVTVLGTAFVLVGVMAWRRR